MATVKELRAQAKARKIPKYYRLSKPQLMSALGVTNQSARPLGDARARSTAKQHGIAKTYAADKLSSKLGGSDEAKKVAIKQRIVKSVSKELKAHEKKIGRKLTIEEKRSVAVKALSKEVKAIRSGMPEQGGKAKQPTPDTAKMYAYRDRYLAKKAEKEKAEKAPKHGSAPFKRRKGGALASIGGRMERTEKNEPKNESKQAEAKEAKLKPQEAIDHKHSNPSPTDAHIDGWLKDTALRVGKPSAANIQKATIEQLGNQHNLQTKGIKTLDAMTSAIHAKLKKSKRGATLADAKEVVDRSHKIRTERANVDYKAIQDGDKVTIERIGKAEAYKLPGNYGVAHRPAIEAHLVRTFSKNGGDSKALGLKPGADFTVAELKNAYRSSSLKAHPDRGGSVEKFQALKESYDRMLPKAKSPALDKVAADTGMTREEVAKAVKRRKAKAEPSAKKAPSEDKPWNRKLTREEIAKKRKENEKLRKTRTDSFFDENSHHSPAF